MYLNTKNRHKEEFMKISRSIAAVLVVAVLLTSSCLFASADGTLSYSEGTTYTIEAGVTYTNLTMTSGQNGNTVSGVAMEFNPKDGFIPMTFVAYAGNVNTLKTQYDVATSAKYGYDVAGAINGSYFTLSKGGLDYANISNGRLTCAHVDQYNREVVTFDKNGNMQSVWSKLEFKLFAEGVELPNAIYCINKQYKNYKDVAPYAVYYYDTSCGTITDTTEAGYEIVCQKTNGTDIAVGKTLTGKVLEVKANTYGTEFETNKNIQSDKFVLFVKAESNFATTLKNLKAGSEVSIQVNETNSAAKSAMENALSTITNVGWVVKNGVDQTRIESEIGGHGVTLQHRQTVFGQKPDGTYIFLTTEGASTGSDGSLTLRDAADYFISQGCTNVIRMDGGGSSGMYVKNKAGTGNAGYTQESQRAVADSILVVKRSSVSGAGSTVEEPTGENVALGKTYTGADVSGAGSYSAKLTDGIISSEMAYNSNWFGYYYNKGAAASNINAPDGVGTVSIDLEAVVDGITDVRVHVWNHNSSGIMAAKSIKLLTSDDGDAYTEIGELAIPTGTYPDWATIKTDSISARYIRLAVETQGTWTFLNEIEVYADPDYEPDPEPDPEPEPEPEPANIALNKNYETAEPLDGYNASLTDGVAATNMSYSGDNWFAFKNNKNLTQPNGNVPDRIGTVVIDLDGRFDITEVKINAIQNEGSGVGMPAYIKVYLSDDGESWGTAAEIPIPDIADTVKDQSFTIEGVVTGTASFIKLELALGEKTFLFINEIEVYGIENDSAISLVGDIDLSGKVDSLDYLMVKRACFGTYTLTKDEKSRADIDNSGKLDSTDYLFVKRIAFGTYSA